VNQSRTVQINIRVAYIIINYTCHFSVKILLSNYIIKALAQNRITDNHVCFMDLLKIDKAVWHELLNERAQSVTCR